MRRARKGRKKALDLAGSRMLPGVTSSLSEAP